MYSSEFKSLGIGKLPAQLIAVKLFWNATFSKFLETDHGWIIIIKLQVGIDPCLLEPIVCRVYNPKGLQTLLSVRWELFRSKNLDGEMLPPTSALLLHILCANYITMRDKSYQTICPELTPIEANEWRKDCMFQLCVPVPSTGSNWAHQMWLQIRLQGAMQLL